MSCVNCNCESCTIKRHRTVSTIYMTLCSCCGRGVLRRNSERGTAEICTTCEETQSKSIPPSGDSDV